LKVEALAHFNFFLEIQWILKLGFKKDGTAMGFIKAGVVYVS